MIKKITKSFILLEKSEESKILFFFLITYSTALTSSHRQIDKRLLFFIKLGAHDVKSFFKEKKVTENFK